MKTNDLKKATLNVMAQMVRVETGNKSSTNSFCSVFLHQPKRPKLEQKK